MQSEEKVVFAIAEDRKTVILGVSEASWEHMKNGMTHTFDLTSLGVPFKIIMFGGKTRTDVLKPLNMNENTLDLSGLDFGFGGQD